MSGAWGWIRTTGVSSRRKSWVTASAFATLPPMHIKFLAEGAGIEPAYARCSDAYWFSGPAPYRSANPPNFWRRRRDSNADSLFGIGRLAPCWFNQFTHVSANFWCHRRESNPQTLVSKTSGYAYSPTVALVPLSGVEPPNTAF